MPPTGFKPTIPASERPQIHTLARPSGSASGLLPAAKATGPDVKHSSPSRAEVNNEWSYTSTLL